MAHTRTWNTAYEATPADGDDARAGANRIRDLKADISERLQQDHSWDPAHADDDDDGFHNKVTLLEQSSAPTNAADKGLLYTLDSGGVTELYYKDSAGNATQLTVAGLFKLLGNINSWTAGNTCVTETLTDGATVTPDCDATNTFYWEIGGNRTLANPTNPVDGFVITIKIEQDGTGTRIISYGTKWKFPSGSIKTLSTGVGDIDLLTAIYDSVNDVWLANLAKNYV